MKKVVTFGEALLRFSPPNHLRFSQANLYELHYGGAELNTAISLSLFDKVTKAGIEAAKDKAAEIGGPVKKDEAKQAPIKGPADEVQTR